MNNKKDNLLTQINEDDINLDIGLLLKETRVKKYKSYRIKIKKEFNTFEKNNFDKDTIKTFEKSIKKINPNLVIKQHSPKQLFLDVIATETNDHGYLDEAKTALTKIESRKLNDIIYQSSIYEDKFQKDPTFDKQGNLSLEWLKNDSKFNELKYLQQWNLLMANNNTTIENILKEKIYNFKNSISKSQTQSIVDQILPSDIHKEKIYKNTRFKKILYLSVGLFVLATIAIIILIVLIFI